MDEDRGGADKKVGGGKDIAEEDNEADAEGVELEQELEVEQESDTKEEAKKVKRSRWRKV